MENRLEVVVTRTGARRSRGRSPSGEGPEERTTAEQRGAIRAWFTRRVPDGWFEGPPSVTVDDDEILVIGQLPAPSAEASHDDGAPDLTTASDVRVHQFRQETREQRMGIAEEAQRAFGRPVSWGVACDGRTRLFTAASVPVMTRLRITERVVLDTLIDAGVARSRSEALAWCVRLVGANEKSWISELRQAFEHVERVRSRGPGSSPGLSVDEGE